MSPDKTIYLVRHCHDLALDNMDQEDAARVPLSSYGVEQAHYLARFMRSRGVTAVYSSIYERSKQTAEIIHAKTGGEFIVDERFNEQALSRAKLDQRTAKDIKRRMLEDPHHVPEGGQSLSQSIDLFLQALSDAAQSPHKNICIVSHAFLMEAALQRGLELPTAPKFAEGALAELKVREGNMQLMKSNFQPFLFLRIRRKVETNIRAWLSRIGFPIKI